MHSPQVEQAVCGLKLSHITCGEARSRCRDQKLMAMLTLPPAPPAASDWQPSEP